MCPRSVKASCVPSGCYPCPGPCLNPIALGSRWLAYAENKVVYTYTHIHPVTQVSYLRDATYLPRGEKEKAFYLFSATLISVDKQLIPRRVHYR